MKTLGGIQVHAVFLVAFVPDVDKFVRLTLIVARRDEGQPLRVLETQKQVCAVLDGEDRIGMGIGAW